MATLSDVAARAGVSVSAVSRVLAGAPEARVSDSTRRRIREAAAELQYRPNVAGRALKLARTDVIALVVPDLTSAIFTELVRGVEDQAHALGYAVLLARGGSTPSPGELVHRLVGEGRVDGLLVQVGETSSRDDLAGILDGTAPAVLVNSSRASHVGSVTLADEDAARIAVEYLVALGHRRIGFLGGRDSSDAGRRRTSGFRAAMSANGLSAPPRVMTAIGFAPADGRAAVKEVMSTSTPPTAVVVANVNAALGALLEARLLGIPVPERLSVIAIHDLWHAENSWPPLTTVRMPLYELGRAAVVALAGRINDGVIADVTVLSPAPIVVVRGSTAPPSEN